MHRGRTIIGEQRALEEALWREIESIQRSDRLAPVTIVAPSRWLVRHLKLTAVRRFPEGLFGVRLGNFFQFVLDLAGDAACSFMAEPIFFERFLLEWLESLPSEDHPFPSSEAWTYDLAGALAAAIRDLRDAAVPSEAHLILERLREAAGEPDTHLSAMDVRKFAALLRAYRHYTGTLTALGVTDRAGVHRAAAANAATLQGPLFVYGFYDMTQVQADLVAELARHTPVTLFVPGGSEAETWKFSTWFRDTFAPSVTAETVRLPVEGDLLEPSVHNARGEEGEVWFCVKEIRRLLDEGCPAHEIAVVSRTLDGYLSHVERLFRQHSVAHEGRSSRLLLDHPLAQMIRLFFRASLDDFPRAAVLDVIGHPLFRASEARRHWNRLARVLRISHGDHWRRLEQYRETGYRFLAGGSEEDGHEVQVSSEEVAALRQAVERLTHRTWPDLASWREHAEIHRAALDECIAAGDMLGDEVEVFDAVCSVLKTLGLLDRVCAPVFRGGFLDAFERECQRRSLENPTLRGVAVLDAMAIRGLSFKHVFLLGMNARMFPRFIVEEPFISDAVRREVFRVLGHHLAVRMDGYDEERLLFHLVRAAATQRFVCVYQRADTKGRLRDPSPFLRPFLPLDRGRIDAIPHPEPARRVSAVVHTPREQIIAAQDTERALASFGYDTRLYARGRAFLRTVDQARDIGEYEGYTGPVGGYWERCRGDGLSATQLELFARCPFRYFAQHVLHVLTIDEYVAAEDLTPVEIGRLMHAILERFYRGLAVKAFDRSASSTALEGTAAEVRREFEEGEGTALHGLCAIRWQLIVRAVRAFVEWDVDNLGVWEPSWFEEGVRVEIAGLGIRTKIDRVDRHRTSGQLRVVEYKRRFGQQWKTKLDTQAKRGQKLQGPLYMRAAPFIAARHGHRDAEAIEASFHFIENYAHEDPSLPSIRGRRLEIGLQAKHAMAIHQHVERAIATFGAMIRDGWFFPRPEEGRGGHCTTCDFAAVCRKGYGNVKLKAQPDHTEALRPYWQILRGSG